MDKSKLDNTVCRQTLIRRARILFWCFANTLIIAELCSSRTKPAGVIHVG